MKYQIVERCQFVNVYTNKPMFPEEKVIGTFDSLWRAKLYRWWKRFGWEGISLATWRWDIEPINT
jgi:hypothetical protein